MGKSIYISCKTSDSINLDDATWFQGELKTLSDNSFKRLRQSILNRGFSFPIFLWNDGGNSYLIDGHQRALTLKKMRDEEGYEIPKLPVVYIDAGSRREAADKVLAATSNYGEITPDGLYQFMNNFEIKMPDLETQFQFPEISIKQFENAYFSSGKEVSLTAGAGKPKNKELLRNEFDKFTHQCPRCSFEYD